MANTMNDLYLKYVNDVGRSLEEDRYFQYLFEMVESGNNTIEQQNQVLHKVVDERWLGTIEESLDAINNIIDKPRRFIATKEEVVPVALAKKISADSVRHLSMNTQFIASDEGGNIMPSKILNVSTEESFDLYENRFVYHLIQRLVTFIDKRTDVIFWSTGDEKRSNLVMQSKVDDAYEEINYKIEMTIKNRKSFAENDTDNMNVFMRIDRVRRLTMALRSSSFCSLMAGCAKVRSPIQRTNLMMKDPDYRTCYKLWQFLESYEEVGYTIDVQNSALEFDEEYLLQMYTNMITNYTVFKSILESDQRDVLEEQNSKHTEVKPKFIKEIKEEFVDDYNIPDVEIRKVFVEEVTQAQLDAEAKLAEEEQKNKDLSEVNANMEDQIQMLYQQINALNDMQQEAEERIQLLEQENKDAEAAVEEAEKQVAEAEKHAEEAKAAQEKAEAEAEKAKADAEADMASTKETASDEIAAIKANCENEIAELKNEHAMKSSALIAECDKKEAELKAGASALVERTKKDAEAEIAKIKADAEEEIVKTKADAEAEIAKTKADAEAEIVKTKADAQAKISGIKDEAEKTVIHFKSSTEKQVLQVKEETNQYLKTKIAKIEKQHQEKLDEHDKLNEQKIQELSDKFAADMQVKDEALKVAEAKAEGNRFTKIIERALSERRTSKEEQKRLKDSDDEDKNE